MTWWQDHQQHAELVAAILAALREAKLASIGGGIAVGSAVWGWLGLNYQPTALLVGVGGLIMSAIGVCIQMRRHRALSLDEDRRFEVTRDHAIREELRRIKEHELRMEALRAKNREDLP